MTNASDTKTLPIEEARRIVAPYTTPSTSLRRKMFLPCWLKRPTTIIVRSTPMKSF